MGRRAHLREVRLVPQQPLLPEPPPQLAPCLDRRRQRLVRQRLVQLRVHQLRVPLAEIPGPRQARGVKGCALRAGAHDYGWRAALNTRRLPLEAALL